MLKVSNNLLSYFDFNLIKPGINKTIYSIIGIILCSSFIITLANYSLHLIVDHLYNNNYFDCCSIFY